MDARLEKYSCSVRTNVEDHLFYFHPHEAETDGVLAYDQLSCIN